MDGIFVAHANDPHLGFSDPKYPDDFTIVAVVEIPKGQEETSNEALAGYAFQETNNINGPWTDNPSVTVVGGPGHRSTSSGDIVVTPDGSVMLCQATGWKEIQVNLKGETR